MFFLCVVAKPFAWHICKEKVHVCSWPVTLEFYAPFAEDENHVLEQVLANYGPLGIFHIHLTFLIFFVLIEYH